MMSSRRHAAFTLVELLTVIAILAVLLAILLPVLATARGTARESACVANLRQIGQAFQMYAQDADDLFPFGGDPVDLHSNLWAGGTFAVDVTQLGPLHDILRPYTSSLAVWRCPADVGYDASDISGAPLDARPTGYERFGSSYVYRTELTLRRLTFAGFACWETVPPFRERGLSDINLVSDAVGAWHGGMSLLSDRRRYNVLLGDGHARNLGRDAYLAVWDLQLERPGGTPVQVSAQPAG